MSPEGPAGAAVPSSPGPAPWRFRRNLGIIAALGMIGRAFYIVLAKPGLDACERIVCGDALYYVSQGVRIAQGRGFEDPAVAGTPAADHPPLTALLMAPAGFFYPDHHVTLARTTMMLVGTAVIVAAGMLGRRLAGDRAGLFAAALAAANPNLWMNDALPMSEAPATLAVLGMLLCMYRLLERPDVGRAVQLGLVAGVAVLTRAELALFLPLAIIPAIWWRRPRIPEGAIRRVLPAVVACLVGAAVVLPWTAFNLVRFDEPVLISTNEGLTVAGTNCDEVYRGGGKGFWNLECARRTLDSLPADADQSVRSSALRDEGLSYARAHRDELPGVIVTRLGRVWTWYHPDQMVWLNQGEGRERWASWSGMWAFWLMIPPATAGVVRLRRGSVPVWPLLSTVVVVSITAAAFYGIVRFRIPADGAQTVLAGVGVAWGFEALRARRTREAAAPAPAPGAEGGVVAAREATR